MTQNPRSAGFARLASLYLESGETAHALELCRQGLERHPGYTTGHLVCGQVFSGLGRYAEAVVEFKTALSRLPGNPVLESLLAKAVQDEEKEFETFASKRTMVLEPRRKTLAIDEYIEGDSPEKENSVEFLLNRLQGAGKLPPVSASTAPAGGPAIEESGGSKIVTPTLAEIYASQGEYGEAIEAYEKLLLLRPEEGDRFRARIAALAALKEQKKSESGE